ncbi:MAG: SBBP repeat-containing protein [Deltaproteobacteria bacterium]|jgi:hypothetical protein|nr:SBBP repeat-containing protein [Deltaproteobacteria bacterium]MBW2535561.1 SBBP repeat-containing protein [Deltaproteobacteria bacterium]
MHPTLARFSSTGAEIWDRSYIDNVNDPLSSDVALDSSGNIFIAGRYDGPSSYDVMVRKHTSSGTETWTTTHDGGTVLDLGNGIAVDSSDNAIAVGWSNSNGWIGKYDTAGNELWVTAYDGGEGDIAQRVAVDGSDDIVVVGTSGVAGQVDVFLGKFDSAGGEIWTKTLDGPDGSHDYGNDVAVDSLGNILVVGSLLNDGDDDVWLAEYDSAGTEIWTTVYPDAGDAEALAVAVDSNDNGIVITSDGYVRKYAP